MQGFEPAERPGVPVERARPIDRLRQKPMRGVGSADARGRSRGGRYPCGMAACMLCREDTPLGRIPGDAARARFSAMTATTAGWVGGRLHAEVERAEPVSPDRSKPWEVRIAPDEDPRRTKEVPKPGTS